MCLHCCGIPAWAGPPFQRPRLKPSPAADFDLGVVPVRRTIFTVPVIVLAVALTGCSGLVSSNGSNSGTKTVAPTIAAQPASQIVAVGQTATFSVTVGGNRALELSVAEKQRKDIGGATGASYTTPAAIAGDSGTKFDVIVSNSAGSVTSTMATLTVNAAAVAPTITTQPANQSVTVGQTVAFSVTATGTAPLTYQ